MNTNLQRKLARMRDAARRCQQSQAAIVESAQELQRVISRYSSQRAAETGGNVVTLPTASTTTPTPRK